MRNQHPVTHFFLIIGVLTTTFFCLNLLSKVAHAESPRQSKESKLDGEELYFFQYGAEFPDIMYHEEGYKAIRSKEICQMAKDKGFADADCVLMIAHLYHECGSMDEYCGWKAGSYRSDAGLAIGIAQWHLCYRYSEWMAQNHFGCPHGNPKKAATIRDKFFLDFPEMKDWRAQADKYVTEMKDCTATKSLNSCIDSWNASPSYMNEVRAQMPTARLLLSA